MINTNDTTLEIFEPEKNNTQQIPLVSNTVSAGFPSPADDYKTLKLDLNQLLIDNAAATFFARVSGDSMIEAGVNEGDLLVVDKSVEAYNGCLAVCFIEGEFTLKRYQNKGDHALLLPANPNYKPLRVNPEDDFQIWGVVRYLIKKM